MEVNTNLNRKSIRRLLIANRGEIVSRIIQTCDKLEIEPVVVYSTDDANRPYVTAAHQSILLEGDTLGDTYLNQEKIIQCALKSRADAIHPGYGFLSENADFAQKVINHQLIWIGPSPSIMRRMADKTQARKLAENINIPVIPAFSSSHQDPLKTLTEKDFPILLKAAAGGGGRGMRIVHQLSELNEQIRLAGDEAQLAFGDDRLFIEKFIDQAKHIEVQILGDKHGNYLHFFERECTVQRRYQKIIEESPAPSISKEIRRKLTQAALELAKASNYDNAGTVEFLVSPDGGYYFIETNARIQVEHPVTEMVTGIDLIEQQIYAASGHPLSIRQNNIQLTGHALECRICAESPNNNFAPFPGKIDYYHIPDRAGVRTDTALYPGAEISAMYDSLIAKTIVHGPNRIQTIQNAIRVLKESAFMGIETNIPYLIEILSHQDFQSNNFFTSFIGIHHQKIIHHLNEKRSNGYTSLALGTYALLQVKPEAKSKPSGNPWKDLGYWRALNEIKAEIDEVTHAIGFDKKSDRWIQLHQDTLPLSFELETHSKTQLSISVNGQPLAIQYFQKNDALNLTIDGFNFEIKNPLKKIAGNGAVSVNNGEQIQVIKAPLPGKLSRMNCSSGDAVKKGETLAIIESMKVENQILAPTGGQIGEISVQEGDQVKMKQIILTIEQKNTNP